MANKKQVSENPKAKEQVVGPRKVAPARPNLKFHLDRDPNDPRLRVPSKKLPSLDDDNQQ